jgi:hypothetical protein
MSAIINAQKFGAKLQSKVRARKEEEVRIVVY